MSKEIIRSDEAPEAIGPYSLAVKAGGFLFVSGQIPRGLDGGIVGTTVEEQTKKVMENLQIVLEAGGATFAHVVRTTIYLADMDDFATVNDIYGAHFPEDPPARVTVEVSRLPADVLVEIDAVAYVGS